MSPSPDILYSQLLDSVAAIPRLPDKPEETPEAALAALWLAAAGRPTSVTRAANKVRPDLTPAQVEHLQRLIEKRRSGQPLAHLTGRQEFMGLEFCTDGRALIPRKETEILAQAALGFVRSAIAEHGSARVIDVCTGSGNVAIAVTHHAPQARVWAADLSPEAVDAATANAAHLKVDDRVAFRAGDLFAPLAEFRLDGSADVVTCNPPYIASQNVDKMDREISSHEPRLAFDGGPFGIGILNRVLTEALQFLKPGGWLCIEVGAGQGAGMQRMIQRTRRYQDVRTSSDAHGVIRSIQMQKAVP